MLVDTLSFMTGATLGNAPVESGPAFPTVDSADIGELFYLTSGLAGLYIFNGESWISSGDSTLATLSDTSITSLTTGETLIYNGTKWVNTPSINISLYATLASPVLSGTPSAPTPISSSNNTQISTTAFVVESISSTPITGLSDVLITDVVTGQALMYSGTEWTNQDIPNYEAQAEYWANIAQEVNANPVTFSTVTINSSIVLSNNNLTATFIATQSGVLSTIGYNSGKYYAEVKFVSGSASGDCSIGLAPSTEPLSSQIGYNDSSGAIAIFQNSGNIYRNGTSVGSGSPFSTVGNTVGVAVDFTNKLIWFCTSGGEWNGSGTANPSTGTGGLAYTNTGLMYLAVATDEACVMTANFDGSFVTTCPSGFNAWGANPYTYIMPIGTTATAGGVITGSLMNVTPLGVLNPNIATSNSLGVASFGSGLSITSGQVTTSKFTGVTTLSPAGSTPTIDLSLNTPIYHLILNESSAVLAFANCSVPSGFTQRFTTYIEQGVGSSLLTYPTSVLWVGGPPILGFTVGSKTIIEWETFDGITYYGFPVGQINPA